MSQGTLQLLSCRESLRQWSAAKDTRDLCQLTIELTCSASSGWFQALGGAERYSSFGGRSCVHQGSSSQREKECMLVAVSVARKGNIQKQLAVFTCPMANVVDSRWKRQAHDSRRVEASLWDPCIWGVGIGGTFGRVIVCGRLI